MCIRDRVYVDPALGTVAWLGGDLDPEVLYAQATGEPLLNFTPEWARR